MNLDKIKAEPFDQYLILGLSKKWLDANGGKPISFDAKLTKDGYLVLLARLENLSKRTNEVDSIVS